MDDPVRVEGAMTYALAIEKSQGRHGIAYLSNGGPRVWTKADAESRNDLARPGGRLDALQWFN